MLQHQASDHVPRGFGKANLFAVFDLEANPSGFAIRINKTKIAQIDRHCLWLTSAFGCLALFGVADRHVHAVDDGLSGFGID
jgi:hypothetical protein